jgi:hypothetical protein
VKKYRITTLHNNKFITTYTGKDLYCAVLDKFNIEYVVEEIGGKGQLECNFE